MGFFPSPIQIITANAIMVMRTSNITWKIISKSFYLKEILSEVYVSKLRTKGYDKNQSYMRKMNIFVFLIPKSQSFDGVRDEKNE